MDWPLIALIGHFAVGAILAVAFRVVDGIWPKEGLLFLLFGYVCVPIFVISVANVLINNKREKDELSHVQADLSYPVEDHH